MNEQKDLTRFDVIDDLSAEAMRRLGGLGRLRMMNELTRAGRLLMAARIRQQNPVWSDKEVEHELARRVRHAAA